MKTLEILDIFKVNKIGRFINSFNKLSIRPFRFNLPKDTIFKKEQTILKGSKILYKSLIKNKVDTAFIYSGGSVMPLIDELYKSRIKYFVNSHEQNCGHAATGYAKTSNKPGVVIVTSGPGITNMITPMLDATNDSTPLVVFSGQVSLEAIGSNAFQEAPAVEISKNVTKWSYQIKKGEEIEYIINKAFRIANEGKKGSVHIDLPKCVLSSYINSDMVNDYNKFFENQTENTFPNNFTKMIQNYNIKKIPSTIDIINKSKKPILYIGQGCNNDYQLLRDFAIKGNIPVTTTIHANGCFDEEQPLSLRWCGMHGSPVANYSIQDSDCIIALGSRFDDRTTGLVSKYAPKAFDAYKKGNGGIIHVNIENSEINKIIDSHYNYKMTCKEFLEIGVKHIEYRERKDWFNKIDKLKDKHDFKNKIEPNKLFMENVLVGIYNKTKKLEQNIIFTTGVGNHQMQTYQYIKSHYPKKIISSGSLGVMGAGLPYGIGAQVGNPNKMVIVIDGDSSFNMTCSDMKTIVENNLPVKIAIMNNDAQMMVTIWEKLFFNERYAATINKRNPSFTKLANSYGIKSLYCNNIEHLDKTLEEFINYPGAILCEFKIEKGICLPLVGPGKALDDMILAENYNTNIKIGEGMAPS